MADKYEQAEYEKELSQFVIPVKSDEIMSQIDCNKLPGPEALAHSGQKDGQTLMIQKNNEIEVYQWNIADSKWIKIGVAVGSSSGSGEVRQKTSYLGQVNFN